MKFFLLALVLAAPFTQAQRCPIWDTVYYNGNILTGKDLNTDHPERIKSFAIQDGKIIRIDTTDSLNGCSAKNIDLHGAFVMPGFNDAHTHIAFAGQQHLTVDLDNIPSLEAMQSKVAAYAKTLTPGQWITGGGWDHTKWASKTLPTKSDLDKVTAGHPAYLERTDGHIAILNTAALAAANITASTPSPQGGQIDLDPTTNQPTGILRDAALALITPHIPKPDAATRRRALTLSINDALAHGVTSVQDFSDPEDFKVLQSMEHTGELKIRVSEWMPFDMSVADLKKYRSSQPFDDAMLHTGMLKGFMDGSLGSRTAALLAPYSDDPKNSGLPRYDQGKLNAMTLERVNAGFTIGFHAIGDRANKMALDAFQYADDTRMNKLIPELQALGKKDGRLYEPALPPTQRIEHAQVLSPKDLDRFRRFNIIASMQPSHLLTDMAWAGARLGPERSKYAYAWKSLLDHDVVLAFGTDYPVESISPFRGLYAAITRMNEKGTKSFQPQEKLTLNQAIYAYTQGSALAEYAPAYSKGILAPGYYADFVVLDTDLTKATPQQILHTRVLRTVVNGQTQYTTP